MISIEQYESIRLMVRAGIELYREQNDGAMPPQLLMPTYMQVAPVERRGVLVLEPVQYDSLWGIPIEWVEPGPDAHRWGVVI